MSEFRKDQLIVYTNGDRFEIGRIKRIDDDGALVLHIFAQLIPDK